MDRIIKICSRCGEIKEKTDFYKDERRKHGLYSACKKCHELYNKIWISKNPEENAKKIKARQGINQAVSLGRIIKPTVCENYTTNGSCSPYIEAHHEDYDKPLKVRWLCRKCHSIIHKRNTK